MDLKGTPNLAAVDPKDPEMEERIVLGRPPRSTQFPKVIKTCCRVGIVHEHINLDKLARKGQTEVKWELARPFPHWCHVVLPAFSHCCTRTSRCTPWS